MNAEGLNFELDVDGDNQTFEVSKFTLDEGLSKLYTLTLTLVSTKSNIDPKELLLKIAKFSVYTQGKISRTVSGVVSSLKRGDTGFKRTYYTMEIRPELWKLTLKKDSRIFHFKSIPEILEQLLQEHNVRFDKKTQDTHTVREYITQKRETDYEFFSRLAAEEGISFWFEVTSDNKPQMFYSDSRLGCTANLKLIYNLHPKNNNKDNIIYSLTYGAEMAPSATVHKDRNYENPNYELSHRTDAQDAYDDHQVIFDSYGRFKQDEEGSLFTKYRMDELQKTSEVGRAKSNCFTVRPGDMFELSDHPEGPMNDRWQVLSVQHEGALPQVSEEEAGEKPAYLTNSIDFIPALKEWRPDYIHKPLVDGPEVAEIVGPAGEEIYTNEYGCVKVHFHWNRYDQADENASCWVRVTHGWNGNGFGFISIPRIGQEVIISYIDGDIDQPIVTGCVYNGKNSTPLNLPENKTRTTFKTHTHKGIGFNELRFEDQMGVEEIFMHAQKDMNTIILNSETRTIGNSQTVTIGNIQTTTARSIQITALTDLTLTCGAGVIQMSADGSIKILGQNVIVTGSAVCQVIGGVLQLNP